VPRKQWSIGNRTVLHIGRVFIGRRERAMKNDII
jgi:hypothetical protein